jgi:hypothetical protein
MYRAGMLLLSYLLLIFAGVTPLLLLTSLLVYVCLLLLVIPLFLVSL